MITINLLPVRAERRRRKRRREVTYCGCAGVLALILMAALYLWADQRLENVRDRNAQLEQKVKRGADVLKAVTERQEKKKDLERRDKIIEDLDRARTTPVAVVDQLAASVPKQLWFDSFAASGTSMRITGFAVDNLAISTFMRTLDDTPLFSNVDLASVRQEVLGKEPNQIKLMKFEVTAKMEGPLGALPKVEPGRPGPPP